MSPHLSHFILLVLQGSQLIALRARFAGRRLSEEPTFDTGDRDRTRPKFDFGRSIEPEGD